jgi:hypothetical protein
MNTIRLTRSGKLIRTALILVALWYTITSLLPNIFRGAETHLVPVTVYSGESLWTIAEREAPNQDPRDFIAAVVDANHLKTSTVIPGQQILIPVTAGK